MKLLNSHYQFHLNNISQLAYLLGFRGSVHKLLCSKVGVPYRAPLYKHKTSPRKMRRLVSLARKCDNDITYLYQLLFN